VSQNVALLRLFEAWLVNLGRAPLNGEIEEFRSAFVSADPRLLRRAIDEYALASPQFMRLAGLRATYARLSEEAVRNATAAREAAHRTSRTEPDRPGWPVAPGEPAVSYLYTIAWLGVSSDDVGRRAARRYVGAGLIPAELSEELLEAMQQAGGDQHVSERFAAAKSTIHEIERRHGPQLGMKATS